MLRLVIPQPVPSEVYLYSAARVLLWKTRSLPHGSEKIEEINLLPIVRLTVVAWAWAWFPIVRLTVVAWAWCGGGGGGGN